LTINGIKISNYRASSETKKKTPNTPLRIELQLQPTVSSISTQGETQEYPFSQSTTTPIPSPFETIKPTIDPVMPHKFINNTILT